MNVQKGQYQISTDKEKFDLDYIHQFLSQSYWAEGIPKATVKKSIEHSCCFAVFDDAKQIGFARVITDYATFGYLADVFIDENYRGHQLGVWLVGTIMAAPELQGFRGWLLGTRDAHALYAKFGFEKISNPERFMRLFKNDIYKNLPA